MYFYIFRIESKGGGRSLAFNREDGELWLRATRVLSCFDKSKPGGSVKGQVPCFQQWFLKSRIRE